MNILVTQSSNYADEFDTEGFFLTTQEKWDAYLASLLSSDVEEMYFGTNEYLTFSSVKEYKDSFTVTPISHQEMEVVKKLFGNSYGIFALSKFDLLLAI